LEKVALVKMLDALEVQRVIFFGVVHEGAGKEGRAGNKKTPKGHVTPGRFILTTWAGIATRAIILATSRAATRTRTTAPRPRTAPATRRHVGRLGSGASRSTCSTGYSPRPTRSSRS